MARSTYIYLIYRDEQPVAAFTVKHEAITYWDAKLEGSEEFKLIRTADKPPMYGATDPVKFEEIPWQ